MDLSGVTRVVNDGTEIMSLWFGTAFVWPDPWTDIWSEGIAVCWEETWQDAWT